MQNLFILSCVSNFVACSTSLFIPKMGICILLISYKFTDIKVLYLRLKSSWAVEIPMYVHWTCIYINKENVYA